jgi:hypothetical protein
MDNHVGLVGISDCSYDLQQLVQSEQGEITAAVDGNENGVGDRQTIESGGPHSGWSVDDNHVELSENGSQFPPEQEFAVDLLCFEKIVGLNVDALDHARIAEGPGGPAEMVPGRHHVGINMYIAQANNGHFKIVKSLGVIDPKECMQGLK